jgi:hypothetical protein
MTARAALKGTLTAVMLICLACATAQAQWSIGAPGSRQAPPGKHRYAFLVYANPVPGMEAEFNDWYTTTHIGDLVQLPGWVGAQRFRIVSNVTPRPTTEGYRHGYLIIWEIEDVTASAATKRMIDSMGGKIRRGAAFDYTTGVGASGMYEVMGPRTLRSDGKGPSIPDREDPKAARINRYLVMDFSNPAAGREAELGEAINQRIKDGLTLPGWLAAQRFRIADNTGLSGRPSKPQFLTVWEIQAQSAQAAQDTLTQAIKNGTVKSAPIDEKTAEFIYWEPITPYITREDFER